MIHSTGKRNVSKHEHILFKKQWIDSMQEGREKEISFLYIWTKWVTHYLNFLSLLYLHCELYEWIVRYTRRNELHHFIYLNRNSVCFLFSKFMNYERNNIYYDGMWYKIILKIILSIGNRWLYYIINIEHYI